MKKFFKLFAIALIALFITTPVYATTQDMWAYVYRWSGEMTQRGEPVLSRATSNITFKVLQRNSDSSETLYEPTAQDTGMTSLTNPVSTTNFASDTVCNDMVAFRVDPTEATDTYVDLIVVDVTGGFTAFVEDFTQYKHTIIIDERPGIAHHGFIWFTAAATETDTGIDFTADTKIIDIWLEVITGDSSATMNVGLLSTETNGDANGLLNAVPLTNTGYRYDSGATFTRNASNDSFGGTYYGALMAHQLTGSTTYQNATGGYFMHPHVVEGSNAASLTYTASAAGGAAGYIHYVIIRMR